MYLEPERLESFKRALITRYGDENVKPNIKSSLSLFEELISEEVDEITVHCWYELGKIHLFGYKSMLWHKYDIRKSFDYFKKSSDHGHPGSQYILSIFYSYGFYGGVEIDKSKSILYLKSSANMEYIPSMLALAYRLLYGIDVIKDISTAISIYKKVFKLISNQEDLLMYITPMDEMRLTKDSISLYKNKYKKDSDIIRYWESRSNEDPMAKYELAKIYENTKETQDKALELYKEAANQNIPQALRDLGLYYINVKKDLDTGRKLLERALKLGDYEAANYLGHLHYKNHKLAIKYFKIAATHEIPEALYYLAELLKTNQKSLNVVSNKEDLSILFQLYKASADYGFLYGYWKEGQMLESGMGSKKNILLAAINYKIVSESHFTVNNIVQSFDYYINNDLHTTLFINLTLAHSGVQVGLWNVLELISSSTILAELFEDDKVIRHNILKELLIQGDITSLYKLGMDELKNNPDLSKYYFIKGFYSGDLKCMEPLVNIFSTDKNNHHNALKILNYKQYRNEINKALGSLNTFSYTLNTMFYYKNVFTLHVKSLVNKFIRC